MVRSWQAIAVVSVALGLVSFGCSTNEAATQKCKESKDCAACCKAAGANGNASGTVNGKYSCKCLGG